MGKAKSRDYIRAMIDGAMPTEVLAKLLARNTSLLIKSEWELGIVAVF
jgi:hypothetical protein